MDSDLQEFIDKRKGLPEHITKKKLLMRLKFAELEYTAGRKYTTEEKSEILGLGVYAFRNFNNFTSNRVPYSIHIKKIQQHIDNLTENQSTKD